MSAPTTPATSEISVAIEADKGIEVEQYLVENAAPGSVPDIHGNSDDFKDATPTPEASAQPSPIVKAGIIEEEGKPFIRDHDFSGIHIIPRGSLNKPTVTEPKPKPKPKPKPAKS